MRRQTLIMTNPLKRCCSPARGGLYTLQLALFLGIFATFVKLSVLLAASPSPAGTRAPCSHEVPPNPAAVELQVTGCTHLWSAASAGSEAKPPFPPKEVGVLANPPSPPAHALQHPLSSLSILLIYGLASPSPSPPTCLLLQKREKGYKKKSALWRHPILHLLPSLPASPRAPSLVWSARCSSTAPPPPRSAIIIINTKVISTHKVIRERRACLHPPTSRSCSVICSVGFSKRHPAAKPRERPEDVGAKLWGLSGWRAPVQGTSRGSGWGAEGC